MTILRWFSPVILLACLATAQTPAPPKATVPVDITGVVAEVGLNTGIADAEVTARFVRPGVIGVPDVFATVHTDSSGNFRIPATQFGNYILTATKPGYTHDGSGNLLRVPASTQINVVLDAEHPRRAVRFSLARPGELTGRMVDAETGSPIAGLTVTVQPRFFRNGLVQLFSPGGGRGVTDAEGKFAFKTLSPGQYAVVVPSRVQNNQLLTQFYEEASDTIDEDYPESYWPGSGEMDSVQPLQLISGGSMDAGTIRLRKTKFYRIRVDLANNNCEPGSRVSVVMMQTTLNWSTMSRSGTANCGQPFLLRHSPVGSYTMILSQGEAQNRNITSVQAEIVGKNLRLTAALGHGVDISGRFVAAEGAGPIPLDKLQAAVTVLQGLDEMQSVTANSQGGFKLLNRGLFEKLRVRVQTPANTTYYVKEIRYNGALIQDDLILLNAGSPAQSIEIVMDDQPANVSGTVKDGDKDVDQPYVVLAKWPLAREFNYSPPRSMSGTADGTFRFGQLAPGEYRVFAVAQVMADKLDEPGVMQRMAERAEKLTVGRGSSQTVTLKLADPSR